MGLRLAWMFWWGGRRGLGAARWMGLGGGIRRGEGQVKPKTTAEATARLWLGRGLGREADFSAALLAKYASSFGRNDDFLDREKRTDNGNRRSFDYSTHDHAVSAFAQD